MTRHIPAIRNGTLHEEAEEALTTDAIAVESAAWYAWLECHYSFRFESPTSAFTARKEQRAGSWYWYAYRRQAGRLRTAYLGKSIELSLGRLQVIADTLIGIDDPIPSPTTPVEQVLNAPVSPSSEQAGASISESISLYHLPQLLTSLLGREQEVRAAVALLQRTEVRLLSMIGTGGVGKTRLALQVATDLQEYFADGVHFVALAPVRDPQLVLPTIAQTLGLTVMGSQSFLDMLKTSLREKHCLLLLDNFEQVTEAAPQLSELLEACLHLKLLVTSREVLHLRGEHQFSVPPLALPERKRLPDVQALAHVAALELFLQRAQAIQSDFRLTADNAAATAEICLRLDGLPLAIELAAARIKVFTPHALLTRLDHRLQVLTGGARDLPERQRTLRSTIAWSYELLSVEEQRLFRRLAVFADGATLEAIEAVATALGDDPGQILDGIASLINKSLLRQTEQEGGELRFAMLETIREYGLEVLASCGEMQAAREAHARYYFELTEQAKPHLQGPEKNRWLGYLEAERANLRATLSFLLEHARAQARTQKREEFIKQALNMCGTLYWFWFHRKSLREGLAFLEHVLVLCEDATSPVRARALVLAADVAYAAGYDFEQMEARARESLQLFRTLEDKAGMGDALWMLGVITWVGGQYAAARLHLEEAVVLSQETGDAWSRARCFMTLGRLLGDQGEYDQAITLLEESLALYQLLGEPYFIGFVQYLLGRLLFLSHQDLGRARRLIEQSLVIYRELSDLIGISLGIQGLGEICLVQGNYTQAHALLEESIITYQEVGDRRFYAEALMPLARVAAAQGDLVLARSRYEESLAILHELNIPQPISECLNDLGEILAAQGEPGRAARLWGRAEAWREERGIALHPIYRIGYERAVTAARRKLGERVFATAWTQGRVMTLDQILIAQDEIPLPPPAKASPGQPQAASAAHAGLTAREIEVLRLLAQGLTSAQIAERLVIGLVTVNSHVRSIYSKLGVTSRSAATRYAIEHHLV